jgi:Peptidase C80 family
LPAVPATDEVVAMTFGERLQVEREAEEECHPAEGVRVYLWRAGADGILRGRLVLGGRPWWRPTGAETTLGGPNVGILTYSGQLIINLLTGTDDGIITTGSDGLHKKFVQNNPLKPARVVTLTLGDKTALLAGQGAATDAVGQPANLGQEIAQVTDETRLYIRGHGDWANQTVGGWTGEEVAQLLAGRGLGTDRLVNVTGCKSGKDSDAAGTTRVTNSMDSFAARLHRALKTPHGLECMVAARVYYVTVMNVDIPAALPGQPASLLVTKLTRDEEDWTPQNHRPQSKVLFLWVNGQQVRKWWDYAGGDPTTWANA